MSLRHAILGLLSVQPMTGYDLKTRCFDGSVAHFWPADQSQVYRTLDRLVRDGHATATVEPGQGPERKVYRLTRAGDEELDRWLESEVPVPAAREPHLVQLFFSARVDDAVVRGHLERWRAEYARRLAEYEAIPLPPLDADVPEEVRRQRMTLEMGLLHARAGIEWADRCLEHLGRGREGRRRGRPA